MSDLGLASELDPPSRDDALGPYGGERLARGGLMLLVALAVIAFAQALRSDERRTVAAA